jgi:hypothetical protein
MPGGVGAASTAGTYNFTDPIIAQAVMPLYNPPVMIEGLQAIIIKSTKE